MRRRLVAGIAGSLAGLMLLAPGALADDSSAEQDAAAEGGAWYETFLGLDAVHATTTGEGVRVAVIDDGINLNQPEFAGANLEVYPTSFCSIEIDTPVTNPSIGGPNEGGAHHGTVTSLYLVGNGTGMDGAPSIRGVAPGVDLFFYPVGGRGLTDACGTVGGISEAAAVDQAVSDGVDVISISLGLGESATPIEEHVGGALFDALRRAQQAGIVVVASTRNEGGTEVGFPANVNGVVTVEALTPLGTVSQPQNSTPQLDIVAPGANMFDLDASPADVWPALPGQGFGTSIAAPVVASAIALGMAAWPEATPHQVLQALASTARPLDGSPAGTGVHSDDWGFGAIDLPAFVATDPSGLPDENPFIRADGLPAPGDLAVTASPDPTPSDAPTTEETTDAGPTAEPTEETPEPSPTSEAEVDDGADALPFVLGGLALALGVVIVGVVLYRRRSAA